MSAYLDIASTVRAALATGRVVALESTVIAHGLPYPHNLETAREMEQAIRKEGATPATIAIIGGKVRIGLNDAALQEVATATSVRKVSRRDIAACLVHRQIGATTVAATMYLAHLAGIRVFATGGIGGVHRSTDNASRQPAIGNLHPLTRSPLDVSADLPELARTPVCVVCSGAKAILDLAATLEWLETWGVPVIGYGTGEFPAFYTRSSGLPLSLRCNTPEEVADICRTHWALGLGGVLVTVPVPEDAALSMEETERYIQQALAEANEQGITGSAVTPFLLKRIAALSGGASLRANVALLRNNAAVAARIAIALGRL